MQVSVNTSTLSPIISNDTAICGRSVLNLSATGGKSYSWTPVSLVSSPNTSSTSVYPDSTTTFYVTVSNTCNTYQDSVEVVVVNPNTISITNDTICSGDLATITAGSAVSYSWLPHPSIVSGQNSANLTVQPTQSTQYQLAVIDSIGCRDTATAFVELFSPSEINAGSDVIIPLGSSTNLLATGDAGSITWSNPGSLNCATCRQTQAFPEVTTEYVVELIDTNGCSVKDSMLVQIGGILRVPNTFTPNGDGTNDVFYANGVNVTEFRMQVFNRWGQLIFETTDINQGWNGSYLGTSCKVDTYVWKVTYNHLAAQKEQLMGHVNLVR